MLQQLEEKRQGAEYQGYISTPTSRLFNYIARKINKKYLVPPQDPRRLSLSASLFNTTKMDSKNKAFHIKIADSERERFEVPLSTSASILKQSQNKLSDQGLSFDENPFSFTLTKPGYPSQIMLTSREQIMVYQDRFIELDLLIASNGRFWGLGDRAPRQFFLKHGIYTNYNLDSWTPIENGLPPGKNMYGMHPILFTGLQGGKWMALFMNNVNAHDWVLLQRQDAKLPLLSSFITTGGIIDLYIILGDRIEEVVQTYHELIGRPVLVPLYSMGFNQCRWGYTSQDMLEGVVQRAVDTQFPMEVLWVDIDYMDRYMDFSIDYSRYPNLTDFVLNSLHPKEMHFVPIIDVGIATRPDNNPVYEIGAKRDAYFKSGYTNQTLIGRVWPGSAAFVNLLPGTTGAQFWKDQVHQFFSKIPFSGLWLDMEQVSNFCSGECPDQMDYQVLDPVEMFSLKWVPGRRSLNIRSLSLNAYVRDAEGVFVSEYDLHSLHGFLQSYATSQVFTQRLKMRPFIISRSTAMGAGRWSSHWLGDNHANWEYLGVSITEIMYFNMYGFPLVGADVCAHMGDSSFELCGRWMQLGAFYPFMRVHKSISYTPQQPWGLDQEHLRISKEATLLRLSLLRYLYSEYFRVHKEGGTLISPLFFRWEEDERVYEAPEKNFLFGRSVMISPILQEAASQIEIYFPQQGTWVNIAINESFTLAKCEEKTYPVDRHSLFVHLTPGRIIPFQHLKDDTTQTAQLSSLKTALLIALDKEQKSRGRIVFDDGVTLLQEGQYWDLELSFASNTLHFALKVGQDYKYEGRDGLLGEVKVYGLSKEVKRAVLEFKDTKQALELEVKSAIEGNEVEVSTGEIEVSFKEIKHIRFLY